LNESHLLSNHNTAAGEWRRKDFISGQLDNSDAVSQLDSQIEHLQAVIWPRPYDVNTGLQAVLLPGVVGNGAFGFNNSFRNSKESRSFAQRNSP
jgi:hypothetical protein